MKTSLRNFRIIAYGDAFSELKKTAFREAIRGVPINWNWSSTLGRARDAGEYLLVSSKELNNTFADKFRERATQATRLLVFHTAPTSTDYVLARIVDLQIRTSHRFYVFQGNFGSGKSRFLSVVQTLLKRLTSARDPGDNQERILDVRIEDGVLRVVSPDFTRLDVPMAEIPELRSADPSQIENFEVDEDGSFIYWPDLDLHLGWSQLRQIVDPEAARKALQHSRQFNVRYGKAVRKIREDTGLKPADIAGLSEKQLGRIEKGECRLTSNAIEALSKAHGLKANEYLRRLGQRQLFFPTDDN